MSPFVRPLEYFAERHKTFRSDFGVVINIAQPVAEKRLSRANGTRK
jgi:hypothetical protein